MGFYQDWVLPRLLNLMCGNKYATEERKKALAEVSGTVRRSSPVSWTRGIAKAA